MTRLHKRSMENDKQHIRTGSKLSPGEKNPKIATFSSRTWPSADGKEDCPVNVTVTNLQGRIIDFTQRISYINAK